MSKSVNKIKPLLIVQKSEATAAKDELVSRHNERINKGIPTSPDNAYIAQMLHDLIELRLDPEDRGKRK